MRAIVASQTTRRFARLAQDDNCWWLLLSSDERKRICHNCGGNPLRWTYQDAWRRAISMEVLTPKTTRRSTRLRVEIPVSVTSLDRQRPYAEKCLVVIVSAQGCGFRSTRALQLETPIMLSDLPGGRSVTARVANCLPLGSDGKSFLVGAALYTHGNVWGIADPPQDWNVVAKNAPAAASTEGSTNAPELSVKKQSWPYNVFADGAEAHPGRK
jgi:hypothetical protein